MTVHTHTSMCRSSGTNARSKNRGWRRWRGGIGGAWCFSQGGLWTWKRSRAQEEWVQTQAFHSGSLLPRTFCLFGFSSRKELLNEFFQELLTGVAFQKFPNAWRHLPVALLVKRQPGWVQAPWLRSPQNFIDLVSLSLALTAAVAMSQMNREQKTKVLETGPSVKNYGTVPGKRLKAEGRLRKGSWGSTRKHHGLGSFRISECCHQPPTWRQTMTMRSWISAFRIWKL